MLCGRQIPCVITAPQYRYITGCGTIKTVSHLLPSPQTDKWTSKHLIYLLHL
jgi:hypothetical protein